MTTAHDAFLAELGPVPAGAPFRIHADPLESEANWDAELEALHEEATRTHFLDVSTRRSLLDAIAPVARGGAIVADLGCSTGYLLADIAERWPDALAVGVDLVPDGLRKAHREAPGAELVLGDVTDLPFPDGSIDAIVSANVVEHVPDDGSALREFARVLRPGGIAAVVAPAGPGLYDYYDRFLHHERRYGRHELAGRMREAGLAVSRDAYVGSFIYPPFWLVKKRNRRRYAGLQGQALLSRVSGNISSTQDSRLGHVSCAIERALVRRGITIPFGVRTFVVAKREEA